MTDALNAIELYSRNKNWWRTHVKPLLEKYISGEIGKEEILSKLKALERQAPNSLDYWNFSPKYALAYLINAIEKYRRFYVVEKIKELFATFMPQPISFRSFLLNDHLIDKEEKINRLEEYLQILEETAKNVEDALETLKETINFLREDLDKIKEELGDGVSQSSDKQDS